MQIARHPGFKAGRESTAAAAGAALALAGVLAVLTGWRYVVRQKDPTVLPSGFLVVDGLLAALVFTQVYLGDELVWVYGLHTVPVVDAIRSGVIS